MDRDRRRARRWAYLDSVRFYTESVEGSGRLLNLAHKGVFVGADDLVPPGETVRLVLDRANPPLEIVGVVRWAGQRASDGALGFGVEIGQAPKEYTELVESVAVREPEGAGRRPAPRVAVSLPVAIQCGNVCDEGELCDISLSGARLENTGIRPEDGQTVTLTFALSLDEEPFDVDCRVVRRTEGGYAVEFAEVDPRLKEAVDRATQLLRDMPDTQ